MNLVPAVLESTTAAVGLLAVAAATIVHKHDSRQPAPANFQTIGMYVRSRHLGLPTEMPQPAMSETARCRRRLVAKGELSA